LVAEVLADTRRHHKERLHDNQPEWARGMRGLQQEALADGRRWHDKRQCNNQPDKMRKGDVMRGGGVMMGGGAGRREAVP
jgi:hypothetical protein